jgi:hemolysin activation/secretion protein
VVTVLDDAQVLWQATVGGDVEYTAHLADGHGLAMVLSAALTAGDLSIARQMLALGGAGGLRGYGVDELLGRARVLTRVEYRHVFVHDLDINLLHSLYLRGIGGAVFTEAGVVSACDSYKISSSGFGADAGYSLRFFADWFGVSQTTFNLDLAVPLYRPQRSCFGPLPPPSTPFGFFVYFGPLW